MSKTKADVRQLVDALNITASEEKTLPVPPQRARLIELMSNHKMTAKDVGELLARSERTVLIWRCDGGKEIPVSMLELLELKLSKGGL